MDEEGEKKGLGSKRKDTYSVNSNDKEFDSTVDTGLTPRDDTVRPRIVVKEGRRREALKKRRPSNTT